MPDQIEEKTKKIEAFYQDYLKKMEKLKKHHYAIIDDFIKKIQDAKIEEIRNKIK